MFLAKPLYTVGEIAQLLNAYEQTQPADRRGQRPIWNRRRTRELLGHRSSVTFAELRRVAPDVVRVLIREQAS